MAARTLNKNNSAVKRIMQEARELANDPCTDYSAAPLEDDIFEWHCTLRGPAGTDFDGGLYHFRILLPAEYPFRPPSIMLLTPNGRFELNTKICISFTSYHEELWQPAWGIRTALIGLQGFFPLKGQAAIGVGSLEVPTTERRRLAALSREWVCPRCARSNIDSLPDPPVVVPASAPEQTPLEGGQTQEPTLIPATTATPPAKPAEEPAREAPAPATTAHEPAPTAAPQTSPSADLDSASTRSVYDSSSPTPSPSSLFVSASTSSLVAVASGVERVRGAPAVTMQEPHRTTTSVPPASRKAPRPPVLLDTAICVLLVLVFALICKRIF